MQEITFVYETEEIVKNYEDLMNKLLADAKRILKIDKALSLSVNYISKEKSLELNKEFRNKDYLADVISFPIDDDYGIYDQLDFRELGDIFICFYEAQNKAHKMSHTLETEVGWLFVHGLLHILGYDHEVNDDDAKVMFDLTDKILASQNITYEME